MEDEKALITIVDALGSKIFALEGNEDSSFLYIIVKPESLFSLNLIRHYFLFLNIKNTKDFPVNLQGHENVSKLRVLEKAVTAF